MSGELVERLRWFVTNCESLHSPLVPPMQRVIQEAVEALQSSTAREASLVEALEKLANAADDVGVRFFDTDTMEPEVEAMQSATLAARALLQGRNAAGSSQKIETDA